MRRIYIASTALAAIAAVGFISRAGQAPPAPAADHVPQIAVVRAAQVTNKSTEWKQMTQGLKARYNEMKQDQQKKELEIQQSGEQLAQLKPGSPQWSQLRDSIDDKKLALEVWGKKMELELQRRQKEGIKTVYDHVEQAVQKIAEDRHLDLVLADNSPDFAGPDFDSLTAAQLQQLLALRGVLFTTKKADITEDVLTLVEANYARQNQAASIPAGH